MRVMARVYPGTWQLKSASLGYSLAYPKYDTRLESLSLLQLFVGDEEKRVITFAPGISWIFLQPMCAPTRTPLTMMTGS
jgi:hypothetical protein